MYSLLSSPKCHLLIHQNPQVFMTFQGHPELQKILILKSMWIPGAS